MEQRGNYAAVKDVQIMQRKEECAAGMEQSAILICGVLVKLPRC